MPLNLFKGVPRGKDAASRSTQSFTSSTNPASSVPTSGQSGVKTPASRKQAIKLLSYPEDIGASGQGHYIIFKVHDTQPGKVQKTNTPTAGSGGRRNRSIALKGTTKRTKTQIGLYMPPTVSVTYKTNYEPVEIGGLAESGSGLVGDVLSGTATFGSAGDQLMGGVGDEAQKKGIALADTIGPQGLVAAAQIRSGKIRAQMVTQEKIQ